MKLDLRKLKVKELPTIEDKIDVVESVVAAVLPKDNHDIVTYLPYMLEPAYLFYGLLHLFDGVEIEDEDTMFIVCETFLKKKTFVEFIALHRELYDELYEHIDKKLEYEKQVAIAEVSDRGSMALFGTVMGLIEGMSDSNVLLTDLKKTMRETEKEVKATLTS